MDRALVEVVGEHVDVVRGAGFEAVEVDPRGLRSGSMNELLDQPDRHR